MQKTPFVPTCKESVCNLFFYERELGFFELKQMILAHLINNYFCRYQRLVFCFGVFFADSKGFPGLYIKG